MSTLSNNNAGINDLSKVYEAFNLRQAYNLNDDEVTECTIRIADTLSRLAMVESIYKLLKHVLGYDCKNHCLKHPISLENYKEIQKLTDIVKASYTKICRNICFFTEKSRALKSDYPISSENIRIIHDQLSEIAERTLYDDPFITALYSELALCE